MNIIEKYVTVHKLMKLIESHVELEDDLNLVEDDFMRVLDEYWYAMSTEERKQLHQLIFKDYEKYETNF